MTAIAWIASFFGTCTLFTIILFVFTGLRAKRFARKSGLSALIERYLASHSPVSERLPRQTIGLGELVLEKSCTVALDEEGLYLLPRTTSTEYAPVLVPWASFGPAVPGTIGDTMGMRLPVGDPPIAYITLPNDIYEATRHYLNA